MFPTPLSSLFQCLGESDKQAYAVPVQQAQEMFASLQPLAQTDAMKQIYDNSFVFHWAACLPVVVDTWPSPSSHGITEYIRDICLNEFFGVFQIGGDAHNVDLISLEQFRFVCEIMEEYFKKRTQTFSRNLSNVRDPLLAFLGPTSMSLLSSLTTASTELRKTEDYYTEQITLVRRKLQSIQYKNATDLYAECLPIVLLVCEDSRGAFPLSETALEWAIGHESAFLLKMVTRFWYEKRAIRLHEPYGEEFARMMSSLKSIGLLTNIIRTYLYRDVQLFMAVFPVTFPQSILNNSSKVKSLSMTYFSLAVAHQGVENCKQWTMYNHLPYGNVFSFHIDRVPIEVYRNVLADAHPIDEDFNISPTAVLTPAHVAHFMADARHCRFKTRFLKYLLKEGDLSLIHAFGKALTPDHISLWTYESNPITDPDLYFPNVPYRPSLESALHAIEDAISANSSTPIAFACTFHRVYSSMDALSKGNVQLAVQLIDMDCGRFRDDVGVQDLKLGTLVQSAWNTLQSYHDKEVQVQLFQKLGMYFQMSYHPSRETPIESELDLLTISYMFQSHTDTLSEMIWRELVDTVLPIVKFSDLDTLVNLKYTRLLRPAFEKFDRDTIHDWLVERGEQRHAMFYFMRPADLQALYAIAYVTKPKEFSLTQYAFTLSQDRNVSRSEIHERLAFIHALNVPFTGDGRIRMHSKHPILRDLVISLIVLHPTLPVTIENFIRGLCVHHPSSVHHAYEEMSITYPSFLLDATLGEQSAGLFNNRYFSDPCTFHTLLRYHMEEIVTTDNHLLPKIISAVAQMAIIDMSTCFLLLLMMSTSHDLYLNTLIDVKKQLNLYEPASKLALLTAMIYTSRKQFNRFQAGRLHIASRKRERGPLLHPVTLKDSSMSLE
jgi:hypothetical protein